MEFISKIFGRKEMGEGNSLAHEAKSGTKVAPAVAPLGMEIATFAGGCFWGIELAYQRIPGVTHTSVGYTQGQTPNPTYEMVCSGSTGHTEAVQMYYNPKEVSYAKLIDVLLQRTDPTMLNRQGNDRGTQYRSGIYFHNEAQKTEAERVLKDVQTQLDAGTYPRRTAAKKIMIELKPAGDYYLAENYHQQYLSKGGRFGQGQCAEKGCEDPIRCYG